MPEPRLDAPGALHHVMGRCADVARFLGINTSAVNWLATSYELPEVEKFI